MFMTLALERHPFTLLFSARISSYQVQPTLLILSRPNTSSKMFLLIFYPIFHFLLLSLVSKDLMFVRLISICPALLLHSLCWCSVSLPCGRGQMSLGLLWQDFRGSILNILTVCHLSTTQSLCSGLWGGESLKGKPILPKSLLFSPVFQRCEAQGRSTPQPWARLNLTAQTSVSFASHSACSTKLMGPPKLRNQEGIRFPSGPISSVIICHFFLLFLKPILFL